MVSSQPPPRPGRSARCQLHGVGAAALTLLGRDAGRGADVRAARAASADRRTNSPPPCARFSPQTCAQCHNAQLSSGGMSVAELTSPESLVAASRCLGKDPAASSRWGHAAGRCPATRSGAARRDDRLHRARLRAGRRLGEAGSRADDRAPAESQRVHQHHPRSAGRAIPRGEVLPGGRFRRRLRQHRRRAHGVASPDGALPGRRRAHRRMGDLHGDPRETDRGWLPGARPQDSPRRSQHHRGRTSHRVRRRVHRPLRASGGAAARQWPRRGARDAGLLDGRQSCWRRRPFRRSRRASSTSIPTPRKSSGCICRKAITCSAPAFIGDEFVKSLPNAAAYDRKKNKFLDSIVFVGPFTATTEKESRRKVLTCNPDSGRACVERIVTDLARRAYRRLPTRSRGRRAAAFRGSRKGRRSDPPSRACSSRSRRCWCRPISCSASSAIPTRAIRARVHEVSPFELASRVSYFLWSSMPDDELLALAGSGRLRDARRASRLRSSGCSPTRARPPLPRTSPASGSRRATSMPSSRIRTSSRNGIPSCAMP